MTQLLNSLAASITNSNMRRFFFLLLAAAILIMSCPPAADNPPAETRLAIPYDLLGMVHAGYTNRDGNGSSGRLEDEYALLDRMGVHWMLRDFSWDQIEPEDNNWRFNWPWTDRPDFDDYVRLANSHNKKIMGLLAYEVGWIHGDYNAETGKYACGHTSDRLVAGEREVAAFCEYVKKTVERYNGKNGCGTVDAWCIWNEPNLQPRFWTGTTEEFFDLTKAAAAAFKEADTGAVLLGGAFMTLAGDEWVKGIFTSGAMDNVDYIAYHPYMPDAGTSAKAFFRFKETVSQYGYGDKIWITEVGYPLDKGDGGYDTKVPEERMPEMVVKTITSLASGGAQCILWYELFDHGAAGSPGDSEAWFGLVDFDTFSKKGGAHAYTICANNIPGRTWHSSLPHRTGLPANIAAYYFEGPDGNNSLVIWNERPSKAQAVRVTLPGSGQKVWDVASGGFTAIGEHSTYTLREGVNESIQFFTWENSDTAKPPRIAVP